MATRLRLDSQPAPSISVQTRRIHQYHNVWAGQHPSARHVCGRLRLYLPVTVHHHMSSLHLLYLHLLQAGRGCLHHDCSSHRDTGRHHDDVILRCLHQAVYTCDDVILAASHGRGHHVVCISCFGSRLCLPSQPGRGQVCWSWTEATSPASAHQQLIDVTNVGKSPALLVRPVLGILRALLFSPSKHTACMNETIFQHIDNEPINRHIKDYLLNQ